MSSAILAKILNSTVGSGAITPLDTLLGTIANNAADRLYTKLKADVKLVGSEDVLYSYTGGWTDYGINSSGKWTGYEYEKRTSNYMSFSAGGSVTITVNVSNSTPSSQFHHIEVQNSSGTKVAEYDFSIAASSSAVVSLSVNVATGDKYKLTVARNNGTPSISYMNVCATPVLFGVTTTLSTS